MIVKHKLYLNRLLSSWGDHLWSFAVGLYLIKVYPESLFLAAIHGVLSSSAIFILAPLFGRWVTKASRVSEVKTCLILQNGCVALSSVFVSLYFGRNLFADSGVTDTIDKVAPVMLVAFSVASQVTSAAYTLCLEQDWLIAIASSESELTDLNAMLRRLDLCCNTVAPFAAGLVMQYSELGSAIFFTIWNIVSGFCEYFILKSIYDDKVPGLMEPKNSEAISEPFLLIDFDALRRYRKEFFRPGISFGLVSLSILGFDSVTVGFVMSHGPGEGLIGIFSLFGALFGILGTVIFQTMAKEFGVRRTALIGFIIDLSALSTCLFIVYDFKFLDCKLFEDISLPITLFLVGVTISRAGLWMIDLSVNQLIQTETQNPPLIGGVQTSVNIVAELIKFSLVAFLPALSQFWILILISYTSITIGFVVFFYFSLLTSEQLPKDIDSDHQYNYGSLDRANT